MSRKYKIRKDNIKGNSSPLFLTLTGDREKPTFGGPSHNQAPTSQPPRTPRLLRGRQSRRRSPLIVETVHNTAVASLHIFLRIRLQNRPRSG